MKRMPKFYVVIDGQILQHSHYAEGRLWYQNQKWLEDPRGRYSYFSVTTDGTIYYPVAREIYQRIGQGISIEDYRKEQIQQWKQLMPKEWHSFSNKFLIGHQTLSICIPENFTVKPNPYLTRYKFEIHAIGRGRPAIVQEHLTKPQATQMAKELNKQLKSIWK